jgi:hypothetical protein
MSTQVISVLNNLKNPEALKHLLTQSIKAVKALVDYILVNPGAKALIMDLLKALAVKVTLGKISGNTGVTVKPEEIIVNQHHYSKAKIVSVILGSIVAIIVVIVKADLPGKPNILLLENRIKLFFKPILESMTTSKLAGFLAIIASTFLNVARGVYGKIVSYKESRKAMAKEEEIPGISSEKTGLDIEKLLHADDEKKASSRPASATRPAATATRPAATAPRAATVTRNPILLRKHPPPSSSTSTRYPIEQRSLTRKSDNI